MTHEHYAKESLLRQASGLLAVLAGLAVLIFQLFLTGLPLGFKAGVAILAVLFVLAARFFTHFLF